MIFALYIVGLLGTLLVAGQLSDRYGRKQVILPGLLAALVACLLFSIAQSVLVLSIARLLSGIAVGTMVSAGMAAVGDLGGSKRRRQAALLASVSMALGAGLGPLIAGGLAQAVIHPILPVFSVEFLILGSAMVIACMLPLRRPILPDSRISLLRPPTVPAANRRHLAYGNWSTGAGMCLLTKRLEQGRFAWPSARNGKVFLTLAQLAMLMEGINWRHSKLLLNPMIML